MDTHQKLYYEYKHKIDFYLSENMITDNSKFHFSITSKLDIIELSIIYWGYEIIKPTKEILDNLKFNPKFKEHKKNNIVITRQEFILKITFSEGEYKKGLAICEDYKDLPYIWFITPRVNFKNTNDVFLRFVTKESILYMNMDLAVSSEKSKKLFYLYCILVPEKEINIDDKHIFNFKAVKVDNKNNEEEEIIKPTISRQLNSQKNENEISHNDNDNENEISHNENEGVNCDNDNVEINSNEISNNNFRRTQSERIKKIPGWDHKDPIIAKTGDPWSKNSPRFKNENNNIKVTKSDLNKIFK